MISVADKIFFGLGICFLVEQIFYRLLGSYPYHQGFTVRKIPIANFNMAFWESIKNNIKKLDIRTHSAKGEVYVKYRYPSLVIGPLLFIGQVKASDSTGVLRIRIGPISALFVLFLIIYPLVTSEVIVGQLYQLMNAVIVVCIVVYFYSRLLKLINVAILQDNNTFK